MDQTRPKAFDGNTPGEIAARTEGDTVTLTIDGQEVTVPKGTNVLEAAKKLGIEISAFCYHPGLSIAACCRQCLVKVENSPKLLPSCHAVATDGMVVHVENDEAIEARRAQLEFTLVNHPIDCPICDKAGECTLQKLYVDHNSKASRVDVPKVRKNKVVDTGPKIVLDQERCILCSRCIRTCDEVAGEHQLDMAYRNNHEVLDTAPGAQLDNPYALNTVDVCPVGALTSKDFRFAMRAWELNMTPSVCPGCSTGCNIEVHHQGGRAYRLVPRENLQVNKWWMCDEGRLEYKSLRESRLAGPVVDSLPSSWPKALEKAAALIQQALESDRDSVAVVFSPQHTNEDNYVLAKVAREHWQVERLYSGGKRPNPERADDILRDADVNPNRKGVHAILGADAGGISVLEQDLLAGDIKALIVLGDVELSDEAASAARNLELLVAMSDQTLGLAQAAHVTLPTAAWAEINGTFTNRDGLVQRLHPAFAPPGQALPAWEAIVRLARATTAALDYSTAKSVFKEMVGAVSDFENADWGKPAPIVQLRFAASRG